MEKTEKKTIEQSGARKQSSECDTRIRLGPIIQPME